MEYCPSCGEKLPQGADTCPHCGYRLTQEDKMRSAQAEEICIQPIEQISRPVQKEDASKPVKNINWKVPVALMLTVLLVLVCVAASLGGKGSANPPQLSGTGSSNDIESPTAPAGTMGQTEPTHLEDPTDPASPTNPADPTESTTQPTQPTEPSTQPTQPTEDNPDPTVYTINYNDVSLEIGEVFSLRLLDANDHDVDVVWTAKNAGFVSIEGNRITAVAMGTTEVFTTYKGVTYSCIVRVIPAKIATALAGRVGTRFTVMGVVTLVADKNAYIQDDTGAICVRMTAEFDNIKLGDTIIGTGIREYYMGLPQLGSGTYEKSSGYTLTAKETTISALTSADICTYIVLKKVTVTEVYDGNGSYSRPNITVQDAAGNTIQIYKAVVAKNEDGTWGIQVGDVITVKASVGVINSHLELRNTQADEIIIISQIP